MGGQCARCCGKPAAAGLITRLLGPGDTFVDVGAHVGEYTVLAARQVGARGAVHAFEPNPRLAAVVRRNLHLNGLFNATVVERPPPTGQAS